MVFEWRNWGYLGGDSIKYSKAKNILITFKTLLRLLRKHKEEVYSVISLSHATLLSQYNFHELKTELPAVEMAALNESSYFYRREH